MLGFIGAPLAPQIMLAWASITKGPAGIWVIWTLVASYFLVLTSGVATHLILSRRGRYSPSSYMFTGGAIGVIAGMLGAVIVRLLSLGPTRCPGRSSAFRSSMTLWGAPGPIKRSFPLPRPPDPERRRHWI